MRFAKKLISILGVSVVILSFQNCGMPTTTNQLRLFSSQQESGNGGGYEGKPDGTYYHFVPSYTCEGHPAAEQITEIRDGQAYLYANAGNQCANQSEPIPLGDINMSPFQKDFISVKDSLFKRYDTKPEGIPTNLAEVLCRDSFENPTFEIVSHYDREKNEALARVYLSGQEIPDFSVSRILSSNEVQYVSDKVSFKVDLSKPAFADRKFAGKIEKSSVVGLSAQPLVCVIGGSIDTSKWVLKPLTNIHVGGFNLLKNNEILFFSEVSRNYILPPYYIAVNHVFKIGLDNVVTDFSEQILGPNYDVVSQTGPVDDSLFMFHAKRNSEMWPSLFVYDSRTGKTRKLTNLVAGANPEAYYLARPVLTADQHLFFDTQILEEGMARSNAIRVYDFHDDSIREVAVSGRNGSGTSGYVVLPKTNRLLLFWIEKNNLKNIVEIYDAKSKTSSDLKLQMPDDCSIVRYDTMVPDDEQSIITQQVCAASGEKRTVQINVNSGHVKMLGPYGNIVWVSEDSNRFILTGEANTHEAYDIRTGQSTKLPVDPYLNTEAGNGPGYTDFAMAEVRTKIALANDRFLYGLGGDRTAPKMYQVDLSTGVSTPICEAALGKKLFLGKLPNQKVFLFTYDAAVKVYRFYQAKSSNDCPRINEFPSEFPNVSNIIPTTIGFGLLLGHPLTREADNRSREAVFVPIDGRPPLKFNSNTKASWSMAVSPEKNRIVLRGPDAKNVERIFLFEL